MSARLDNLVSCFLATEALALHVGPKAEPAAASATQAAEAEPAPPAAPTAAPPLTERDIALIALFDHEEVGSGSATGAGSPIMAEAVRRISGALASSRSVTPTASQGSVDDLLAAAVSRSFVLSADMAHAVHPNYAGRHEKGHGPIMNHGLVIKSNSNQR
jgi:aspartyl aminopeptidase